MSQEFDYYAALGLPSDASTEEIREAFAALRSAFPADQRDPAVNVEFRRIFNAYEVLNDPARRATYDSLVLETSSTALSVDVKASRKEVEVSENSQMVYLLANILPPRQNLQQRPLNLSLVIDRSTSMKGPRLNNVKTAVELLVEQLTPDDTLSVVSFSDRAEVVVEAGPVVHKMPIVSRVRGIQASGGTEIYQGLYAGVKELRKANLDESVNQLILLTDGHTYGDADQCLHLAKQATRESIGFSAFGIGSEWNDQFLDALVTPSGGQSGYIEDPAEIISYLQQRIKGLGAVYAQNVRLKNNFPDSLTVRFGFKVHPFAQPLSLTGEEIELGDVQSRSPLSFLLEIMVNPQPAETRITIPLTFTAVVPSQGRDVTIKSPFTLYVLTEAAQTLPPDDLTEAVRALNMYRMNEKVWEEVEAGRLDVAATRMHRLSTRLLEAGQAGLAQQASAEAERINQAGTMSLAGRKALKYGTRTLINKTVSLIPDD